MQPIVLRGTYGFSPYDVIVGQRKFLAHQYLEADTIKAVFAGDISDTQALILSLSENLLRQEMNHADIARAVRSFTKNLAKMKNWFKRNLDLASEPYEIIW